MNAVGSQAPRGKRPPGRPVDAALGPAIMLAVRDLLAESGYAGLTTTAVARRAGVSTATLNTAAFITVAMQKAKMTDADVIDRMDGKLHIIQPSE